MARVRVAWTTRPLCAPDRRSSLGPTRRGAGMARALACHRLGRPHVHVPSATARQLPRNRVGEGRNVAALPGPRVGHRPAAVSVDVRAARHLAGPPRRGWRYLDQGAAPPRQSLAQALEGSPREGMGRHVGTGIASLPHHPFRGASGGATAPLAGTRRRSAGTPPAVAAKPALAAERSRPGPRQGAGRASGGRSGPSPSHLGERDVRLRRHRPPVRRGARVQGEESTRTRAQVA